MLPAIGGESRFQLNEYSSHLACCLAIRNVTVANLIDELLAQSGDCVISIEDGGPYYLKQLHTDVSEMDAFLRNALLGFVRVQPDCHVPHQ